MSRISDARVIAALVHGHPDPEVSALVDRLAGLAAPDPDPADPQVHRLNGELVRLRDGALPVRLGCGIVAHQILGWCYTCPGIDDRAEVLAWRLFAAGHDVPDHEWARAVSRPAQGSGRW